MLARVTNPKSLDFSASLTVPPRPESIPAARKAWQTATADREQAQQRHREAVGRQREQAPGQPTVITAAEVDKLGATIGALIEAEQQAKQKFEQEVATYQTACSEALYQPLCDYQAAITAKITELEALLRHGIELHSAARANGVKLASGVPGLCGHLVTHVVEHARRILGRASA